MKLVIGLIAAIIMFTGLSSQAKETKKERSPNQVSTNFGKKLGITVKAKNLKLALEKIVQNEKIKAVIKSANAQLKEFPAELDANFDADRAMVVSSGKSGPDFYVQHLVPMHGNVPGSGHISIAFLLAQVDENASITNLEDENSLKSYTFRGFVKVKTLDISDKNQLSGFEAD